MPQNSPTPPDATQFAVLVFTDICDSTALKAKHGALAYKAAAELHNSLFEKLAAGEKLTLIKNTGDGYFARTTSVAAAVRFALRFQHGMRVMAWPSFPLVARLGIHAGEVADITTLGQADIIAPAADLVARIMSLAAGGQILMSRWPFDEARHFVRAHPTIEDRERPELTWLAHGPYFFKGCDEPIEVFEVGAANLAPLAAPPNSEKAKRAIRPGDEETLGWRPAKGLEIPGRTGWRLAEKLGAGGFGEVWAGEHDKTHERRAYKFCFDAERLRALKREVTLTRLLKHQLGERDDIVRIYDLRLDEAPYFLETELASDGNLLQWAEKQGGLAAIPLSTRIELVAASAEALAAAHSAGVLHKDVKPTNVLIFTAKNGAPRPRLVDFGIGTLANPDVLAQHGITGAGFTGARTIQHSTGTPTYSPPEYLAGKPYTVQGDVFALGVMLYQLVTADGGRPVAEGWQRDVPDELLRADIAACVDGDPRRRLPSATELATRLRGLDARAAEARRLAGAEAARRTRKRRRRVLAAGAATAILIAGVGLPLALWAFREKANTDLLSAEKAGTTPSALALLLRSLSYDRSNGEARDYLGNLLTYSNYPIQLSRLEHVQDLQFINDGHRIITFSDDKTSRIWDADSGKPLTEPVRYDGLTGRITAAEFSPDGTRLVTSTVPETSSAPRAWYPTVRVWDVRTGHPLGEPMKQNDLFYYGNFIVAPGIFSPDGRRLVTRSGDQNQTARVWDTQTVQPLSEPMKHNGFVESAKFSSDGRRIVTVSYEKNTDKSTVYDVRVWDAQSGKSLTESMKYNSSVSAEFTPGGTQILINNDQSLQIWDFASGKAPIEWVEYGGPIRFAEFSQDDRRILTLSVYSSDASLRVWDAQTKHLLGEPIKPEGPFGFGSATFSPDGRRIVTTGLVRVWDVTTGKALTEPMPTGAWALDSATFSPDGKRVVTFARQGHIVCLWDIQNGRAEAEPMRHEAKINAARFSPDGKLIVTVSDDRTARVWDAQSNKPLTDPIKHDHPVRDANFSPDSKRIVTISKDDIVRVWDAESGKALNEGMKHEGFIRTARFSPDGKQILTTCSADRPPLVRGHIWDAATGRLVAGPTPDASREFSLNLDSNRFVSPDGKRKLYISGNVVAVVDDSPFWPVWKRGSEMGRRIPEFWGRIPAWVLRLTRALAGGHLKWRSVFPEWDSGKQIDQNADVIRQIKDQLSREPADNDWAIWGRWFFDDRSTRTISPFSKITVPEYIENRIRENTQESLNEAERLAVGNSELLKRIELARESLPPAAKEKK